MASVVERSGNYLVRVRRKGVSVTRTFSSRREAEAFAANVELDIERGTYRPSERVSYDETRATARLTMRQLAERYLVEVTPCKRGAAVETGRLRALLRPDSAARPIMDSLVFALRPQMVAAWRDARLRQSVKPSTLMREWALMTHILTVSRLDWGYTGLPNPFKDVRKPRVNDGRDRRIEAGELEAICAATGSAELGAFVRLAVETAARRGELLALQWRDVSLQAATATLRTTKNGEVRTIPLTPTACKVLADLPRQLDGRVFTLRPDSVTQAFSRAVKRARAAYVKGGGTDLDWLVGVRLHDARHEAASRLAEGGFSTLEVAAVTGHKTLQLLKRYTHLRPEALAQKLAAIAAAQGEPTRAQASA